MVHCSTQTVQGDSFTLLSTPPPPNPSGGLSQVLCFFDPSRRTIFLPYKVVTFSIHSLWFPPSQSIPFAGRGVRVICPDTLNDWRLLPRWTIMTPEQGPELPSAFASHGLLFWYNPRKFLMPQNIKTPSIYWISFFPLSKFGNNGKASHLTKAGLEWHLVAIF